MKLDSLQALYIEQIHDLHSAEQQIVKALPKMRKNATHQELGDAFDTHLEQTKTHVQRLEQILADLGEKMSGKKCKGMEGLLAEGEELLKEDAEPDVLDAGLIAAAQRVEHYELAGYGTARTYAQMLGFDNHVELLQQTLDEEGETNKLLTEIAQTSVNIDAMTDDAADDDVDAENEGTTSTRKPATTTRSMSKGRASTSRTKKR